MHAYCAMWKFMKRQNWPKIGNTQSTPSARHVYKWFASTEYFDNVIQPKPKISEQMDLLRNPFRIQFHQYIIVLILQQIN